MGLFDILNAGKLKKENETLKETIGDLGVIDAAKNVAELEQKKEKLENELTKLEKAIEKSKKDVIFFDNALLFQDYGLYTPRYNFLSSEEYKDKLINIRNEQKQMIKNGTAIVGAKDWIVDGSKTKGNKLVSDCQKLFLRAFNSECDEVISKVTYANIDMSHKKIVNSAESIEKLGTVMKLSIESRYVASKLKELYLAFEYQQKKQEEKEAQKEARAAMKEAAKLQKELEEQRKKIEKEQIHYQTAYIKIIKQLEQNPDEEALLAKKTEMEEHLDKINKSIENIDYREANQKAGYVYIISNLGAFGPDIYKIGMTRRLDPQERVDELGDASVPFNFDVHAMIFSENAPALEAALHRAFENKRVNMVNSRREFFNVTLDEIKDVIRANFDQTVEFIDEPEAEQYRISKEMRML